MTNTLVPGFIWSNMAWYRNTASMPEIMIGLYDGNGGLMYELAVRWHNLGKDIVPRLEIFDDAWYFLVTQYGKDLFEQLAKYNDLNIGQTHFVTILKSIGFKDLTQYTKE